MGVYSLIYSIYEKINKEKEEIKLKIQKLFTKIRNELNKREDELLLEIDKIFEKEYFEDDLLKECDKLPKKIKFLLDKYKEDIKKENTNSKSIFLINDIIVIENNIKEINFIYEKVEKCNNSSNLKINFFPEEEKDINNLLNNIKNLGNISKNDNMFSNELSLIKNDVEKQRLITYWIKEKVNKKEIEFELIFKMSENGFNCKDFHKYCDNKGPSLTLIKTSKNQIIGGFTPLKWKNNGGGVKDENNQTFIFSLDLNKKFDIP